MLNLLIFLLFLSSFKRFFLFTLFPVPSINLIKDSIKMFSSFALIWFTKIYFILSASSIVVCIFHIISSSFAKIVSFRSFIFVSSVNSISLCFERNNFLNHSQVILSKYNNLSSSLSKPSINFWNCERLFSHQIFFVPTK